MTLRDSRWHRSSQTPERQASPQARALRTSHAMLEMEIRQAVEEVDRPGYGIVLSAVSAGFGIGIGVFLMAVLLSVRQADLSPTAWRLMSANALAVGFIIVILGRMDLFTEFTTIAILPVLARKASLRALTRLWALIYLGNLAGAAALATMAVVLGPELNVLEVWVFARLAHELMAPAWWAVLVSATLAGWLMGVLSWLITGGRDTISQVVFIWIIAVAIGLGGLHHVVTAAVEVWAGVLVDDSIGWIAAAQFLAWVTLGNAIGGIVFAASVRFSLHMRHKEAPESGS